MNLQEMEEVAEIKKLEKVSVKRQLTDEELKRLINLGDVLIDKMTDCDIEEAKFKDGI